MDAWLATQTPDVEYVSLAAGDARVFSGHEGMHRVWAESGANWEAFRFALLSEQDGLLEVGFTGIERLQRRRISGALWFRLEERDGRIARLWSAAEAADLT